MKTLLLIALCLVLSTSVGVAQGFGGGAHAGISISSFPQGISDFYGIGFGGGAHGDLSLIKFLALRFNVDFHTFASDKAKIADALAKANNVLAKDIGVEGLNVSAIGITVNGMGKIPTGSMLTPYGLVGLGLHILRVGESSVTYQGAAVANAGTQSTTETKFGLNFGAGSEFKVGPTKLYFEVKYVMIFTEGKNTNHLPITFGVSFGG